MRISAVERRILNCIQGGLPIAPEPFGLISKRLKIGEGQLLRRIRNLKERGIIRSLAASVNHSRLGFVSSLVALRVPLDELKRIVKEVVSYEEVTHCFLREGEYNLWVVYISPREEKLKKFLKRFAKQLGDENVLNLRTKQKFKLKTAIRL